MLDEIITLENELAETISAAKQAAATAIQAARTEAADARTALETSLHATEQSALAEAEAKARLEAQALITDAEKKAAASLSEDTLEAIATTVLARYV